MTLEKNLDELLSEVEKLVERGEKLKEIIYNMIHTKKEKETEDIVYDIISMEIDKIIERHIEQKNSPLLKYLFSEKEK